MKMTNIEENLIKLCTAKIIKFNALIRSRLSAFQDSEKIEFSSKKGIEHALKVKVLNELYFSPIIMMDWPSSTRIRRSSFQTLP